MHLLNNILTRLLFFFIIFIFLEIETQPGQNKLHHLLFVMFLLYSFIFLSKIVYIVDIIRPSTIVFYYIVIFMTIGGYNVELLDSPLGKDFFSDYKNIYSYTFINFIIFSCLFINAEVCCATLKYKYNFVNNLNTSKSFLFNNLKIIIYLTLLTFVAFTVKFVKFPILLSIILLIIALYYVKNIKVKGLVFFYIIIISLFSMYHNKREVISILILFIFYNLYINKTVIDFKSLLNYLSVLIIIFCLVLFMSVMRLDDELSYTLIIDYLSNDIFLTLMIDNFEISHLYLSTYLSINYILNYQLHMPPFNILLDIISLPIPRSIWEGKPLSLMLEFTKLQNSWKFENGGSFPVNIYVEFISSFYYLYPVFLYLYLYFVDLFCIKHLKFNFTYKSCISISLLIFTFMLARGSGFDLFILYILITVSFFIVNILLLRLFIKK